MKIRYLNKRLCAVVGLIIYAYMPFAQARYGIALGYQPKYQTFQHFDYVNPNATKGGVFRKSVFGSFDTLNPYLLKGDAASDLGLLMFETLMTKSDDEPFSLYGLLADDVELAEDGLSVTFHLNPAARFNNGDPVTAADVVFSFAQLISQDAKPAYRFYYADIESVTQLDRLRVQFTFKTQNPELHMIVGEIPIFSKKWVGQKAFKDIVTEHPITSGPYTIKAVKYGTEIQFERNPNYWAKDLPVRKGMFNFDQVVVKYYRDQTVILEALKAGEFDFLAENNSKRWARDHVGPKYDRGEIKKQQYAHGNNVGMQGFGFNLRKVYFKEQVVRKAIALAFDFEWANDRLFYNQYTRCDSYFSHSELAATGLPSAEEMALLAPYRDKLPERIFTQVWQPSNTTPPNSLRQNLRQAKNNLTAAGWVVRDGVLQKNGVKVVFEVVLASKAFERVLAPFAKNLKKLGIRMTYRTVDASLYVKRLKAFDFDMIVVTIGQSLSPGNEQINSFHSKSASIPGSRNLLGIQHPVVDALVDKVVYAKNRASLIVATKALDRVLLSQDYLVPNWYIAKHRVAVWDKFLQPATRPLYYTVEPWAMKTWWMRP